MSTQQSKASRRDVLKAGGAVAGVAALGITPTVKRVKATESGEPELTTSATVPSGAEVRVTIDELEAPDSGQTISTATATVSDGESTHVLGSLAGTSEYYDFAIGLGTGGNLPEFDAFTLEVPDVALQNFETVSHDATSWDAKPDDVTVVYDERRLWRYQPKLKADQQTRADITGMYGFVAESESEDTYACCYWLLTDSGEAPTFANPNSALGGHIPIYVFVDEASGEVVDIVYASWQWLAADLEPSEETLTTDRADYPTHATFELVDPYNVLRHVEDSGGYFASLKSLPDDRSAWINNGWYESASATAIENPWVMRNSDREGWWDSSSLAGQMIGFSRRLGSAGGEYADTLRAGDADGFLPSFDFDFGFDFWPFNE